MSFGSPLMLDFSCLVRAPSCGPVGAWSSSSSSRKRYGYFFANFIQKIEEGERIVFFTFPLLGPPFSFLSIIEFPSLLPPPSSPFPGRVKKSHLLIKTSSYHRPPPKLDLIYIYKAERVSVCLCVCMSAMHA